MMNYEGNQLTVDPEHGQELENIFRISNPQSADSRILRYNFIFSRITKTNFVTWLSTYVYDTEIPPKDETTKRVCGIYAAF